MKGNTQMNQETKKHHVAVAAVLAVGMVLAALILTMRPHGSAAGGDHAEHAAEVDHGGKPHEEQAQPAKGPHGGKLFVSGGFSLEVTIFEHNVEPHFRLYAYQDGKPLPPSASKASATVERLGVAPQVIGFVPEADYLKGDATLDEPHSFKVGLQVQAGGKAHRFNYEQVEARITMSELQASQNGVDIHTSGPARIKSVLKLIGEVQRNADRSVQVTPRLAGVVESVHVNAGDAVKQGQLLAVLSSQTLAADRSALLATQQRLELARTVFLRAQKLWQDKIIAEQDYQQAQATFKDAEIAVQGARDRLAAIGTSGGTASTGTSQLARHEVRAPIDGVVTDKRITIGESVADNIAVFEIADLSTVWVEVSVSERDLDTIKTGQLATVMATATEARASGKVSFISPLVGELTRAAKARIVLPNPGRSWRPGAPVRVEVVAAEVTVPVAVLAEAIQTVNDEPAVFGRYGDQFEARPIQTGRSDGQYVEVVKGLPAGVKYAAKNSFLIKADIGKSGASHDH
jgi:cobalt-zinc-cadmium efflux system membrane fusion protein